MRDAVTRLSSPADARTMRAVESPRGLRGRGISLVAGALLAVVLLPGLVRAQAIPVSVGGPASSLVGVAFEVPIQVDLSARADRLGSFAIRIQWNPSVLQFVHGFDGTFGQVFGNEDSLSQGVLRLTGANPAGVGGKVTIGIARAVPLVMDTTTLRVRVDELYAASSFSDLMPFVTASDRAYCPALALFGDLDADGSVTSVDAAAALRVGVGLALPAGFSAIGGDVDGDGRTGPRDALIMLSHAVGLDVSAFRVLRPVPGTCGVDQLPVLAITPGDQTALVGQAIKYTATVTDSTGSAAGISGLTWSTTNGAVATVSSNGVVTAVAPGAAVITAHEAGGHQGSATVTVVATRRTHWVDALAFNATNQLGSAQLPFARIQDAMTLAASGDSVLVRTGRYEGRIAVGSSIVIRGVVNAGEPKPLLTGRSKAPADSAGLVITGGARVELLGFRFDTLYQAVTIHSADTVVIRNVDIRAPGSAYASIYVDSVNALYVSGSRFDGSAGSPYSTDAIYVSGWAHLLSVDSTVITDYTDDAILAYGLDSLRVTHSAIRNNRAYGVYVCNCSYADTAHHLRAVFSHNTWTQNQYGHVYLDRYASARFDHNALVGYGYDGVQLYGDSTSRISLLGDSVAISNGYWLEAERFDSLVMDSVSVFSSYEPYIDGRIILARNSLFETDDNYALEIYNGSQDSSHLVLRNVTLRGVPQCDRCGYGVYTYGTSIDADSVTAYNLDYVFEKNDLELSLRRSAFTHVYEGIESDCGTVRADQVTMTDAEYGLDVYGCTGDSLILRNSTLTDSYRPIGASSIATVLRNNIITRAEYGIYVSGSGNASLLAEDNQISDLIYGNNGIYADLNGAGGALIVRRNTIGCNPALSQTGIEAYDAPMTIDSNTVSGCRYGIYAGIYTGTAGWNLGIRGNTLTLGATAYQGIATVGTYEAARIVGNSITGPASDAAISASSYYYYTPAPLAQVDSNTISGSRYVGIRAGRADTVRVRDNTISNHLGGGYGQGAIVLDDGYQTNAVAQVLRNRINLSKSNGIVIARNYGLTDTVTVLVDSNAVKGADSIGVWVRYYSKALVRKNAIDSSQLDAVRASDNFRDENSTFAFRNNFTRSAHFGLRYVQYSTLYPVVADSNYWGSPNGPRCASGCDAAGGDSVTADVSFANFLTSPQGDTPVPPAPVVLLSTSPVGASMTAPIGTSTGLVAPAPSRAMTVSRPQLNAPVPPADRLPRGAIGDQSIVGRITAKDQERDLRRTALTAARAAREAARRARQEQRNTERAAAIERAGVEKESQDRIRGGQ